MTHSNTVSTSCENFDAPTPPLQTENTKKYGEVVARIAGRAGPAYNFDRCTCGHGSTAVRAVTALHE